MIYDVIVIGGGPAGLMAAVSAAENGASVLLLDKGDKLGRKLAISGGGRCNVTNAMPIDDLIRHIPGNGRFLYSALSAFNNQDIMNFFEKLGIALKEEDHGRMFPVSNNAKSVVDALLKKVKSLNVEIRVNQPVQAILNKEGSVQGVKLVSNEKIMALTVIVAVGGKSVPQTGSTGDGYAWAKACGHTITDLYPTEVPLLSDEPFIKQKVLQGLSLRDVAVTLVNPKGKSIQTHRWDVLFTHFGLSGPAILRLSQFVVKALKKFKVPYLEVQIDTMPDRNEEEVFQSLLRLAKESPKKALKSVWKGIVPERYLLFLLDQINVSPTINYHELPHEKGRDMARVLKAFPVRVSGTLPIEKAFITGGGVSLKEINPKTMASKKMSGLYFSGEIMDLHGYTGGYNITSAFVTGHAAGQAAAREALSVKNHR
ncbi:aminoacetone oxidase family FAD-binding enzyme [Terrilactibacillus sp. BCM23-1]|uniref:Aminoacetone oxidase family FAD-binding enzyme n=1 Tax=Terrilactibacillus tamarindi TaxID=2599694 RepID=A0A6N8CLZ6_9BACI|nr:NAD(P)/FAD-dependent oxidoreductase [Terrilactibacillus tamarindi]MTT30871.1 aminoacetone oxidase family FAD-binding enzyme [Terrilactibacillus tamarindi]